MVKLDLPPPIVNILSSSKSNAGFKRAYRMFNGDFKELIKVILKCGVRPMVLKNIHEFINNVTASLILDVTNEIQYELDYRFAKKNVSILAKAHPENGGIIVSSTILSINIGMLWEFDRDWLPFVTRQVVQYGKSNSLILPQKTNTVGTINYISESVNSATKRLGTIHDKVMIALNEMVTTTDGYVNFIHSMREVVTFLKILKLLLQ